MGDQQVKIVKKKIRPYPFEATLDLNNSKKQVEVIYLSKLGAIVHLREQMITVGEYYQLVFELPVLREFVNTQVRVLKTYDRAVEGKENIRAERVAELHFQNLTQEHKSRIVAFVAAIGQEK